MLCSHLTFAFASTPPSKFNIVSMKMQTQMHRMGPNPFCAFDGDVDKNANANVKCEHSIINDGYANQNLCDCDVFSI